MSTRYYYLKKPFKRIEISRQDDKATLALYGAEDQIGVLTVPAEDCCDVVLMFAERESDDRCPMTTYYGGKDRGRIVVENVRGLDPNLMLVSEYGDPVTVAEIRSFTGG